jgi:hypothetical protein
LAVDTGLTTGNQTPESLTPEEQIVDTYSSYETNHYTGSQVSLFLGPVWVEDFVAIRYKQANSRQPVFGWNEGYSNMDMEGNFLVQGTLTVNFRESDYLFRLIDQIRKQLNDAARREDIDRIIETQKGKFKTRIETRLLDQYQDLTTASQLIEQSTNRVDLIVSELVNQNENVFDFDLSIIAGNYRSKNFAIKIFEKFTINEESGASEPDDTPLYTTYSWYARKMRSRRRIPKGQDKVVQGSLDVARMLDEVTDKLVNGFGLFNKKQLSTLLQSETDKGKKLTLFDVAGSIDYATITNSDGTPNVKGKRRGLIDLPFIGFENQTLTKTDITANIEKSSQIGFGGVVNAGANNYGEDASINKLVISFETPELFPVEIPVYQFRVDPLTGFIDSSTPSMPVGSNGDVIDLGLLNDQITNINADKTLSEEQKRQKILAITSSPTSNNNAFQYKIALSNNKGQLQHVDHEIMQHVGFDIIGEVMPTPPQIRGSGIPVRQLFFLSPQTYDDRFRSGFTNSFLSLSEPITVLENIENIYGDKPNRDRKVSVKMPLFTFTYFDPFRNIRIIGDDAKPQPEIIKPAPVYLMDRIITQASTDKFKSTGDVTDRDGKASDELASALKGTNGKDFVLFPLEGFFYSPSDLDSITELGIDFKYLNFPASKLNDLIVHEYGSNPLSLDSFSGVEKTMHIFPVITNYKNYAEKIDGIPAGSPEEQLSYARWQGIAETKLFYNLLKGLQKDESGELSSVINNAYKLHYDYLLKDASGLNPAGTSSSISFSMIHKLDVREDAIVIDSDKYVHVQYYCLISTYPNFQNAKQLIEDIAKKDKVGYQFINFKGYSTSYELNDVETKSSNSLNDQINRITAPDFHFTYPVGRKVSFETYVRTDFKTYDIQDGILDTFLNFVRGNPEDDFIDTDGSTIGKILDSVGIRRDVLTYARELKKYAGIKLDDGVGALAQHVTQETGRTNLSQNLQFVFGPSHDAIKEWVGYFKSIASLPAIGIGKLLTNAGVDPSSIYAPIRAVAEQEKIQEYDIRNAIAFSGELYLNVNIRNVAKELWKFFDETAYSAMIKDENGRKPYLDDGGNKKLGSNDPNGPKLITRITQARAKLYPTEAEFKDYVVGLLSKKMLDFNTAELERIQIATKRFFTSKDAKVVLQKPAFSDPSNKDVMYIKFNGTAPSKSTVVKFGKNKKEDVLALTSYNLP